MSIIYKTPILDATAAPFTVQIPRGAKPLALQVQHGVPTVWWMCSKEEPVEARKLIVLGTGWGFDSTTVGKYLGTWQDAPFVWHLFESNT